jgi:L-xylulokinase
MLADCLGIEISVAEGEETGALGAALGAGVGAGVFADYEQAVAAMTRIRRVFTPDAAMASHYDHRFTTSRELTTALQGFWATQHRDAQRETDENEKA